MSFQRTGWLAFGLGASMAFHAFLAFWLAHAPLPEPSPTPGSRDAEAIEFQVVPTAGRDTPPPAPARPKRGGRSNGPAAHPLAVAVSMAAPTPASEDSPGTGDEAVAPVVATLGDGTGTG